MNNILSFYNFSTAMWQLNIEFVQCMILLNKKLTNKLYHQIILNERCILNTQNMLVVLQEFFHQWNICKSSINNYTITQLSFYSSCPVLLITIIIFLIVELLHCILILMQNHSVVITKKISLIH